MNKLVRAALWTAAIVFAAVWLMALAVVVVPLRVLGMACSWCGDGCEELAKAIRMALEAVGEAIDISLYGEK